MLTSTFSAWLLLVTVFAAALVSPGPDFVMSVKNSLVHGRRAGMLTALGFALGVLVHVAYTLLGIGALIASSVLLFNLVKYAGAAYLIYLGYKALRSQGVSVAAIEAGLNDVPGGKSDRSAVRDGFFTNLLNPKATLFFVALFMQIIRPEMSWAVKISFGLTCAVMVVGWFSAVAVVMTQPVIRRRYIAASKWIDRTLGVFLIAFGLRLAITKTN
jgi:RhtB (resistance to homoserine/threonine) family protein